MRSPLDNLVSSQALVFRPKVIQCGLLLMLLLPSLVFAKSRLLPENRNLTGESKRSVTAKSECRGCDTRKGKGRLVPSPEAVNLDKFRDGVSVKDFGAAGDGVNNDTAAFIDAHTVAVSIGSELVINPGTYKVTNTLVFSVPVRGVGMPRIMSVGNIPAVVIAGGVRIQNINVHPDGTGDSENDGIQIKGGARASLENITVEGAGNDGIRFDSLISSNNLASLTNVRTILNGRDGVRLAGGINNNAISIRHLDTRGNGGNGITFSGLVAATVFSNIVAQRNKGRGIYFDGEKCRNNIGTAYLEKNVLADIEFSKTAHTNMVWLSNDGTTRIDKNGTNTVLSASSGKRARYGFSNYNKHDYCGAD